jgi:hypothetical protein
MFNFLRLFDDQSSPDLLNSKLYDEETFYDKFISDLSKCQHEVIIESPFITNRRLKTLLPSLQKLKSQKVMITINTRYPEVQDSEYMREDGRLALSTLQHMGIHVLFTIGHHRKLAIIDRKLLYEGSLNILSQNNSCEVMRRVESVKLAWQMVRFTGIDNYVQ